MRSIEVAIWGFGAMGSGMARMLEKKQGIVVRGICDTDPELVGRELYELLGCSRGDRPEVRISADVHEVIGPGLCDLALVATDSFVADTLPRLRHCLTSGVAAISTAEEMAFPAAQSPEAARELDRLAREHGVAVLGTGINPGFVLDALILAVSATCEDVTAIRASRVNDLAPFGKSVMAEQGVGLSKDEFARRLAADQLAGHVGFPESIALLSEGLGVPIGRIRESREGIVTGVERRSLYGHAPEGHIAGIRQQASAYKEDGSLFIHLDHPQQICPADEGVDTADRIEIDTGDYTVNLTIKPEIPGGSGTIAMLVNAIPFVLSAEPGLLTMLDLPLPRAVLGDFRAPLSAKARARLGRTERAAGDYVVIELDILPAALRSPALPADTAELDLVARVKGQLLAAGRPGELVSVRTLSGRIVEGRLTEVSTAASHSYGQPVAELLDIHRELVDFLGREEPS